VSNHKDGQVVKAVGRIDKKNNLMEILSNSTFILVQKMAVLLLY